MDSIIVFLLHQLSSLAAKNFAAPYVQAGKSSQNFF